MRRGPEFYPQEQALRELNQEEDLLNNPRQRSNSPISDDVPSLEDVTNERIRHGYLSLIYGQNRLNIDPERKTKI